MRCSEDETAIGRIYEDEVPGGIKWRWTLYGLEIRGESVPSGFADSLEDAQAKFRAAWEVADKR